jgi:hypothetical protein
MDKVCFGFKASIRKVALITIVEIIYFDASIVEFVKLTAQPAPGPRRP